MKRRRRILLVMIVLQFTVIGLTGLTLLRWSDMDSGAGLERKLWLTTFETLDQLDQEGMIVTQDDRIRESASRLAAAGSRVVKRLLLPPEMMLVISGLSSVNLLIMAIWWFAAKPKQA